MSERIQTIALLVACAGLVAVGGYLIGRDILSLLGWWCAAWGVVGTLIGACATYQMGRADAMTDALRLAQEKR